MDLSAELSPAQLRAVTHEAGPLRVVGGPGGGKTRVLTYRIAWLVREAGIDPQHIQALTFTNKAAGEMKERLTGLLGGEIKIGAATIHSWAYRFLCIYRGKNREGILGAWNPNQRAAILADARQYFAWQQAVKGAGVDVPPAFAMYTVSHAKGNGVSREALRARAVKMEDPRLRHACDAWVEYEKWQQKARVIDFDDLLVLASALLDEPEIQQTIRSIHRWVLLDESQDTNLVQWAIVRKLCPPPVANLTVVGDYDQSIYGWRGAAAENFLEFVQDYEAATVTLETNYRSTRRIVATANQLIGFNAAREQKVLEAAEPGIEGTVPIVGVEADAAREAARGVEQIRRWLADYQPSDVAVLVRAWWLTRSFEERLLKGRIPYQVVGGPGFFGRREVLDLLSYVALAIDPSRDLYLKRTGYFKHLREECEPAEFRNRKENIDEMLLAAEEHSEPADFVFYAEQLQPDKEKEGSGVTLTSIHGAKGLEFPCVIVAGCAERVLPHERCEDIEEERRLAYVAITRAERELLLTCATEYRHREHMPSRFLIEAGLDVPKKVKAPEPGTTDPFPSQAGPGAPTKRARVVDSR